MKVEIRKSPSGTVVYTYDVGILDHDKPNIANPKPESYNDHTVKLPCLSDSADFGYEIIVDPKPQTQKYGPEVELNEQNNRAGMLASCGALFGG
jgi:hypothetical protein